MCRSVLRSQDRDELRLGCSWCSLDLHHTTYSTSSTDLCVAVGKNEQQLKTEGVEVNVGVSRAFAGVPIMALVR